MGLLNRMAAAAWAFRYQPELQAVHYGATQKLSEDGWLVRLLGGGKTKAGPLVTNYSALQLPVVYSAVSLIADTLAQLPLQLKRKRKTGKGADLADDHRLYPIVHDGPNPDMVKFTWVNTGQHHVLLWGNSYAELEQNGRGELVGIWPLLPDRTEPFKRSDSALAYRTTIDGKQFELPPERVLHVPALGFDGYCGYSPIHMARQAVGLGLAMEEFGAKFFANDAKSGGFLMHPARLGAQAQANLGLKPDGKNGRTDPGAMLDAQGGLDNAHRVKVLEEGMKFVATTIPPEDAQFLGSREFQIAEIARLFRVPLVLLQSMEKSSSWGSGVEQLMIGFVVFTMQPWITRWEQELNRKIFTQAERDGGYYVQFNVNALLRGDMAARGQFYESAIRSKWMVPNEARDKEDMNPIEGGDESPDLQGAPPAQPKNRSRGTAAEENAA